VQRYCALRLISIFADLWGNRTLLGKAAVSVTLSESSIVLGVVKVLSSACIYDDSALARRYKLADPVIRVALGRGLD
jgi:hypothetical protein